MPLTNANIISNVDEGDDEDCDDDDDGDCQTESNNSGCLEAEFIAEPLFKVNKRPPALVAISINCA